MIVSRNKIFFTAISCCVFRFFIFPLDDYPDIFYIYKELIKNQTFFSIAEFFDFNKLFNSYSCAVVGPRSNLLNYLIGGGFYKCDFFPISFDYVNYFFLVSSIFIIFLLLNQRLSSLVNYRFRGIFNNVILNLVLLPSTTFFILSLHIDVPYHFLIISFVMMSFILAFKKKVKLLYPIFLVPIIILILTAPDNQAFIFILLFITSLISIYLSKNKFFINFLDRLATQINTFEIRNLTISRRILFNFLFLGTIIFMIVFFRLKLTEFLATPSLESFGDAYKIASIYINTNNAKEAELLTNYPIFLRIFGTIQGLMISTPFGIKPSIFTTLLFFYSLWIGLIKVFSFKSNTFPVFIKIFFLSSMILMFISISIFPFFSYTKYWLFLLPFAALFLSFAPKLTRISFLFIYLELILKSSWFSLY